MVDQATRIKESGTNARAVQIWTKLLNIYSLHHPCIDNQSGTDNLSDCSPDPWLNKKHRDSPQWVKCCTIAYIFLMKELLSISL